MHETAWARLTLRNAVQNIGVGNFDRYKCQVNLTRETDILKVAITLVLKSLFQNFTTKFIDIRLKL